MNPDAEEIGKLAGRLEGELTELGQQALLEHGRSQGRSTYKLRLSIEPAFENPRVWTVDAHGYPDRVYIARRLLWHRELDWERPQAVVNDKLKRLKYRYGKLEPQLPTLESTERSLAAETIEPLLEKLFGLTLPLCPPPVDFGGLDGTTYRLEMRNSMWHTSLAWWSDQPQEWNALYPIINELLALLGDHETRQHLL